MKLPALTRGKIWLPIGYDTEANEPVDLSLERLSTHFHIIGPPGSGKTRMILWLFQQLVRLPAATIILFNVKGSLGTMARDWCITNGYTKRLIYADPQDQVSIFGYNPLRPNHLPIATHAKNVREAIRSAWGQTSFDQTAQLARWLFLGLYVARELSFTLAEALALLRPVSCEREAILPKIQDPYIRREFLYLDGLRESRQDELVAPTLARLQSFVLDPTIRRILTQQSRSLDFAEVIADKKILILNFELYRPLGLDDVQLLGRMIINDILAHVFNRSELCRHPVCLLIDECQHFVTNDLARALDLGRELGLWCVLAHQYLHQLREE